MTLVRRGAVVAGGLAGAVLAAALALAVTARAQSLVADLSSHLIAITTGFTGTEVVLFGSTGGEGDVAVVVTGPRIDATVRRKARIAGIWVNRNSAVFEQVPSYYVVASSRPLEDFAGDPVLERHQIGTANLILEPSEPLPPAELVAFRAALIRNKQREGLYGAERAEVNFLGERLFRTNIYFPANVPTGLYNVEVFLIRNGEVVSAQTTPLVVSKVGFSAEVTDFARGKPLLYGVVAVIGAVAAGWLAGALFRKV
ncbi:TIGR02186 family protein [Azospirillum sp. ST 5-10]|uniref:TIGR02186 family protein n=1 Tax=unclassified Azospirillum TaxID=2630922 RepID=UPI003F4A3AD5